MVMGGGMEELRRLWEKVEDLRESERRTLSGEVPCSGPNRLDRALQVTNMVRYSWDP